MASSQNFFLSLATNIVLIAPVHYKYNNNKSSDHLKVH